MIIKKYSELKKLPKIFLETENGLIILSGKYGLSKSTVFRENLKTKDYLYLSTHLTPLQLYLTLYNYCNEHDFKNIKIVIDDLSNFKSDILISLLKSICDTHYKHIIQYNSTDSRLKNYPLGFDVENVSTVVICNEFKKNGYNGANLESFVDRSTYFEFNPSNEETFKYMKKWKNTDKEIIEFLEPYVPYSRDFSLRVYEKAKTFKKLSKKLRLNWKKLTLELLNTDLETFKIKEVLESNIKRNLKVKKIAKIKNISERHARRLIPKTDIRT